MLVMNEFFPLEIKVRKMENEFKDRNSWDTNKQFEANYIPFEPFDYTQGM